MPCKGPAAAAPLRRSRNLRVPQIERERSGDWGHWGKAVGFTEDGSGSRGGIGKGERFAGRGATKVRQTKLLEAAVAAWRGRREGRVWEQGAGPRGGAADAAGWGAGRWCVAKSRALRNG